MIEKILNDTALDKDDLQAAENETKNINMKFSKRK
jgi:hypothetical protein